MTGRPDFRLFLILGGGLSQLPFMGKLFVDEWDRYVISLLSLRVLERYMYTSHRLPTYQLYPPPLENL